MPCRDKGGINRGPAIEIKFTSSVAPEPPILTTNLEGEATDPESIEAGQMITLVCKAQSGHPEPELTFYRNGAQIGIPQKMRNMFKFRAMEGDNNAIFSCTAYNGFSSVSRSDVTLNVKCECSHTACSSKMVSYGFRELTLILILLIACWPDFLLISRCDNFILFATSCRKHERIFDFLLFLMARMANPAECSFAANKKKTM